MRSVGQHVPPLQQAIHALKYRGARVVASPLAGVLAQCWRQAPLPAHLVIPVPLHRRRVRQRGYNQSLLLARELAKRIGLPLEEGLLVRDRYTLSQVGLSGPQRWANVRGAFRCTEGMASGAHVLLVDDVFTTGATLEACADALKQGGVAMVWALTLTRAPVTRSTAV